MTTARAHDERWARNFEAKQRRQALKERAIAYLGGACRQCGYDKCPAAFDFHHLDATTKDFEISSVMSWERLQPELDKCVLLCATCHREAHDGWHPNLVTLNDFARDFGEDGPLSYGDDEDTNPDDQRSVAP